MCAWKIYFVQNSNITFYVQMYIFSPPYSKNFRVLNINSAVCSQGAYDKRSGGPGRPPSDEPGADGPSPVQGAAHRLPDAQSLPAAPGGSSRPARRSAARGERTHGRPTPIEGKWARAADAGACVCVSDPRESGEESRVGFQYIRRSGRPREPLPTGRQRKDAVFCFPLCVNFVF